MRFLQIIAVACLMLLCAGAPDSGRAETPVCDGMDGTEYVLRIRDFNDAELNKLVDTFTTFACYKHHRLERSMRGLAEYRYETSADADRMRRNLTAALQIINVPGSVSIMGTTIYVEKDLPRPR
jgi:hypothetical protein